MNIQPLRIKDLTARPDFHYLRYGHGAQLAMVGDTRINCDGHSLALEGMRTDLLKTIQEPAQGKNVLYGLMEIGRYVRPHQDSVRALFEASPVKAWVDGDPFFPAIVNKQAHIYIDFLRSFDVCVVGPPHIRKLPDATGIKMTCHIHTHKNCYTQKADIMRRLIQTRDRFNVVLFAAAMLSEVLIWELHDEFKDKALVDVGAFFDPICGVRSRGYARKLTVQDVRVSYLGPSA